jgi:thiamine transport system substrate-binding protein
MQRCWLVLLLLAFLFSCSKEAPAEEAQPASSERILNIFAPLSFRSSGLEAVIIKDFEEQHNCTVRLHLFADRQDLAEAIKAAPDTLDLALGIDNALAMAHDLYQYFAPHKADDLPKLGRESRSDATLRLVPYAYSHLALLYNARIIESAPQSFGEMQDARYLRQLGLLNPQTGAWGEALMHYLLSLFGEDGYEHLLRALKKNVYRSFDTHEEALDALQKGECGMIFGPFSYPAWQSELKTQGQDIQMKLFKEGSYLYTESVGRAVQSKQSKLAEAFITYLVSEPAQKMLLYKSGLLPTNIKVILPMSYSSLPLSVYSLNERLPRAEIREKNEQWLRTWQQRL